MDVEAVLTWREARDFTCDVGLSVFSGEVDRAIDQGRIETTVINVLPNEFNNESVEWCLANIGRRIACVFSATTVIV